MATQPDRSTIDQLREQVQLSARAELRIIVEALLDEVEQLYAPLPHCQPNALVDSQRRAYGAHLQRIIYGAIGKFREEQAFWDYVAEEIEP